MFIELFSVLIKIMSFLTAFCSTSVNIDRKTERKMMNPFIFYCQGIENYLSLLKLFRCVYKTKIMAVLPSPNLGYESE